MGYARRFCAGQRCGGKAGTGTFVLKIDKRSCAVGEALNRHREPFLQLAAVPEVGPEHAPARRHAEYERIDRGGSGVGFLVGQAAGAQVPAQRLQRVGVQEACECFGGFGPFAGGALQDEQRVLALLAGPALRDARGSRAPSEASFPAKTGSTAISTCAASRNSPSFPPK